MQEGPFFIIFLIIKQRTSENVKRNIKLITPKPGQSLPIASFSCCNEHLQFFFYFLMFGLGGLGFIKIVNFFFVLFCSVGLLRRGSFCFSIIRLLCAFFFIPLCCRNFPLPSSLLHSAHFPLHLSSPATFLGKKQSLIRILRFWLVIRLCVIRFIFVP